MKHFDPIPSALRSDTRKKTGLPPQQLQIVLFFMARVRMGFDKTSGPMVREFFGLKSTGVLAHLVHTGWLERTEHGCYTASEMSFIQLEYSRYERFTVVESAA